MTTSKRTAAFTLIFVLTVLTGMVAENPGNAGAEDAVVRIGVLARRGTEEGLQSWSPTARYLTSQIPGTRFEVVPLNFEEIIPTVESEGVDFLVTNSAIYVQVQARYDVSRMVTIKASKSGSVYSTLFGGVILCRSDRGDIKEIRDLKGKTFMGVDETSFGGWIAAWRELREDGINPYRDFKDLLFAGTHDGVVYAVRDGKADAGTVSTSILEEMVREGKISFDDFKVINEQKHEGFPLVHSTRIYPQWPFAKLKHTPYALAEKVAVALLSMPPDSEAAKAANCSGWTVPLDYGTVDECLKELRIGVYKDLDKVDFGRVVRLYRWQILLGIGLLAVLVVVLIHILHLNSRLLVSRVALEEEIVERKQSAKALERLSHQNELILSSAAEGIFGLDLEGNVTFINPAAARMVGWEVSELIGRKHHGIVHHTKADGRLYPWEECPVRASFWDNTIHRVSDEVFWRKDGTSFPVEYVSTPIHEQGKPVGVVVTFSDITERRQAETVLRESEKRFRLFYEEAPLGYQSLDEEARFIEVNRAWLNFFGYSRDEVIGRWFGDFMLPPSRELLAERFACFKELGEIHGAEFEMVKKDGSPAIVTFYGSIGRDEHGEFIQTHCIMRDVTEKKRAEEALRRSQERFRALIENGLDIISIIDGDGTMRYQSPSVDRVLGYKPEELVGKNAFEFIHPVDLPRLVTLFNEAIQTPGFAKSVEYRFRHKDGTWRTLEGVGKNLLDNPAVEGIVVNSRDITDRIHFDRELRQRQKMEAIGTLAGGIAHDFNNVLAAVMGYTEITLDLVPPESEASHNLHQVLKAAGRSKELVKQILVFGRRDEQTLEPVGISAIVKEALKLLRASLPATIEIQHDLAASSSSRILADPTQVHQVLMNLCTNAAHAMREAGGVLAVSLEEVDIDGQSAARFTELKSGPHLKLTISDTGNGIDPQNLERIFDPFFTTKKLGEGTGLGLAVVHGIVKKHDGTITVSSEVGRGTTFQVFLPRIEPGDGSQDDSPPRAVPPGKERVLLVDDEAAIVKVVERMLKLKGYDVRVETDSAKALDLFRREADWFDLVVTDQTMPNMTGASLAKEILSIRPDIPIILCTGYSDLVSEQSAKEMGIREYLMKPLSAHELALKIREVLDSKNV